VGRQHDHRVYGDRPSFDGTELAVHRTGEGKPILLLHGLFSDAHTNWIKFRHAASLAQAERAVFMPDLRAHGRSGKPHDPAAYPPDVLARDIAAIVGHYGWAEFDLAGFSLGARTAARCVINGMRPRRLALVGMGLEGLAGWTNRAGFFLDAIDRFDTVKRGDRAFMAVSFMKTMKVDLVAARLLLQSVADAEPEQLASAITMPTLVLCGDGRPRQRFARQAGRTAAGRPAPADPRDAHVQRHPAGDGRGADGVLCRLIQRAPSGTLLLRQPQEPS
jgi:pimeloyl-ACP methyl ester carboxylesterase